MTNTAIACQRLVNQRIGGEKLEKPEEVVRWLGAIQAQDYLQSLWAIGLRLQSATVADIEQAILEGKDRPNLADARYAPLRSARRC